jgi:hypothetical protein
MKAGLAGIGREKEWIVEIDYLIDLGLYALNVTHRGIELMTEGVSLDRIELLHKFLKDDKDGDTFELCGGVGGRVEFRLHDETLRLFVWDGGQDDNKNMMIVSWMHEEYVDFVIAIKDAIDDATKR